LPLRAGGMRRCQVDPSLRALRGPGASQFFRCAHVPRKPQIIPSALSSLSPSSSRCARPHQRKVHSPSPAPKSLRAPTSPPPNLPVPAWLCVFPRAPEYRSTESEFADPIFFLSRVEHEVATYDICKVVQPYQRPSRHVEHEAAVMAPSRPQAV
jgi:hypothetical protein